MSLNQALELLSINTKNNIYKPFPSDLSEDIRKFYISQLPSWVHTKNLQKPLLLPSGAILSTAWTRIVIGDYGAYIEISPQQIVLDNIKPKWSGIPNRPVKYLWYIPISGKKIKIYNQQATVAYADYKTNMWYVAPIDVHI